MSQTNLTVFDNHQIRRIYDETTEKRYFSVIDIIKALLDEHDYQKARKYRNKLAQRLKAE